MCKTRFGSQGVIPDGFKKIEEGKNLNGTRDLPPFMANDIEKIYLFYFFILLCTHNTRHRNCNQKTWVTHFERSDLNTQKSDKELKRITGPMMC